ncbi:pseudopilin, cryptic, general secretion pathway [Candidatus Kuenenia stuttgartiensis]|uniref:Type II secretion system core protein G n=1 Tax=Kuenenia stuttgartiensis TaxID=174633 RepID=Q1Q643_KUEST|nr:MULTISPECIES: type II secretion system major pseudopilin GspG [Kuenenia]MBE7548303.1 type II secretion system major pseudopilin GspG [Planctomycetia bacterium]MBZ0193102.1 type II secretion system major pseudopilin GspG [Candidatus Kuenenia stuttgartiensis]MCL4726445.1 type II secretion system major pseudopilin GspG [Candidatus Kuenenia stuttgartiensis]MCZ7621038.1 type II secretion system major pseudopilin GspG [Candidatus Kuenenia sp.]QII13154.1 pseudopilin, cryptic, general secretion pat
MKELKMRSYLLRNGGFTLLELLIVMIIIGLLAALIGPKMIGRVGESRQTVAKQQIEGFSTALEMFKLDTTRYPTQEEGMEALVAAPHEVENWKGPYLKKKFIPKDPWGNDYVYVYPGENGDYDIISYGADGAEGGDGENADVVSWE